MHRDIDFSIEGISKIEGHASLDVKIRQDKVEEVKLSVSEDKRFYTQAVVGKNALNVPMITSRICGTCSFAHLLCAVDAVENALNIQPAEQTITLRKLAAYGMIIRDHAMHLYMFSMPDVLNKDSILEFDAEQQKWVKDAFKVKGVGNKLSVLTGGRAVHPTNLLTGGVNSTPPPEEVKKMIEELKGIREEVARLTELFYNCTFSLKQDTRYVCSQNDDFSYIGNSIIDSEGDSIDRKDFLDHFFRVVIPYSEAVGYELEGRDYVVGALARVNLKKNKLHRETKKTLSNFLNAFPSNDIFKNNLAQAIEIMHAVDSSIEILESSDFKKQENVKPEVKDGEGIGVVEAPRGTLYYHLKIKNEVVSDANLVIPTSQNQIRMQIDVKKTIEDNIDKDKETMVKEVEKLVRAYDPCMSCATHFLHVNWL